MGSDICGHERRELSPAVAIRRPFHTWVRDPPPLTVCSTRSAHHPPVWPLRILPNSHYSYFHLAARLPSDPLTSERAARPPSNTATLDDPPLRLTTGLYNSCRL